jgi:hypothetical protein
MKSLFPARPVGAAEAPWSETYEDWAIEPKANGWRGLLDQQEGIAYNRKGGIATNSKLVIERLAGAGIKSRFVDCEIMGMREKVGVGTIIVIDAFNPANPKPYGERVKEFEHIEPASFALRQNALLRMPRLDHKKLKAIWEDMNFHNRSGLVWEGFVMKQDDSYPWVKNPNYCSLSWHKYRIL